MEQLSLHDWFLRFFYMLLIIFMINRLFFFSPGIAELTSSYILYPYIRLQHSMASTVRNLIDHCNFKQQLLDQLQAQTEAYNAMQAELIALKATNDFEFLSQSARQFAQKYEEFDKKLVQVLMRSFDATGHFYWIDAGSRNGVAVDMIAIYKNTIVGRVVHVDPLYSKIALITDKRCKIAVSCATTKTIGIYQGNNSLNPTLEFVPHYENLQKGDMLISTGQGLVYPQGFAVGKIKYFRVDDVAYTVEIEPLIDLERLRFIYLISQAVL